MLALPNSGLMLSRPSYTDLVAFLPTKETTDTLNITQPLQCGKCHISQEKYGVNSRLIF